MSDFNWCHGPECHERHTVDRVRGVKGSKVLRTRKVPIKNWNRNTPWSFFCGNGCYNDYFKKHVNEILAIAPRTEALETPIEDPKKTRHETSYGYGWSQWDIKVDNTRQT